MQRARGSRYPLRRQPRFASFLVMDESLITAARRYPVATSPELADYQRAVASRNADDIEATAYRLVERVAICEADASRCAR